MKTYPTKYGLLKWPSIIYKRSGFRNSTHENRINHNTDKNFLPYYCTKYNEEIPMQYNSFEEWWKTIPIKDFETAFITEFYESVITALHHLNNNDEENFYEVISNISYYVNKEYIGKLYNSFQSLEEYHSFDDTRYIKGKEINISYLLL